MQIFRIENLFTLGCRPRWNSSFLEGFIIMKPYRREDLEKIIEDALEFQE